MTVVSVVRHGYSTYCDGCRCLYCRDAMRRYKAAWKASKRAALLPADVPHGRLSTYTNWDCRCIPCRTVKSEYQRVRRQRQRAS